MHGDGQFADDAGARDGDGRAFEADPFPEFEAPDARRPLSAEARVRMTVETSFIQKTAQSGLITSSGDVAIVVDLPGLVSPGRQAQPGTS